MKFLLPTFLICIFILPGFLHSQTFVQGDVSGTWTPASSPYIIVDRITIPLSDSLGIEPGVVVKVALGVDIHVEGTLLANGTEQDSITFTTAEPSPVSGSWGGIIFKDTLPRPRSVLKYSVIEFGGGTFGGVVRGISYGSASSATNVSLSHCEIRYNASGLRLSGGNELMLSNSFLHHNQEYALIGRQLVVSNVEFLANSGYYAGVVGSATTFIECVFRQNSPGAYLLFDSNSNTTFRHCLIEGNNAGIGSTYSDDSLTVDTCVIRNNNGHGINANALYNQGTVLVRRSLITGNTGDGIRNASQRSIIENNTIVGNGGGVTNISPHPDMMIRNNIVADNDGPGFEIQTSTPPSLRFNNAFRNSPDFAGFSVFYGDTTLLTNRNGDGTDLFMNLRRDPLFTDSSTSDYHLLPASPCIDAGDTTLTDEDGSVSDIGAFPYFHPTDAGVSTTILHKAFELRQNFPNPFNPSTIINFSIAQNSFVTLKIFDSAGRLVESMLEGYRHAGSYSAEWDGRNRASGIYFYELSVGGSKETRKLILLR